MSRSFSRYPVAYQRAKAGYKKFMRRVVFRRLVRLDRVYLSIDQDYLVSPKGLDFLANKAVIGKPEGVRMTTFSRRGRIMAKLENRTWAEIAK